MFLERFSFRRVFFPLILLFSLSLSAQKFSNKTYSPDIKTLQIYLNDNLFATVDAADELPNIYADTITNSLIIDVPIPNTAVK